MDSENYSRYGTYAQYSDGGGKALGEDEFYMKKAIALAKKAAELGEVPVGAVIVRGDGSIIGEGYNLRETKRSPLAHAEIAAIDAASRFLGGWRLPDCRIYVTLEPCAMCAGGIINSRIDRVIFGASDLKAGSCGSLVDLFSYPYNHIPQVTRGVLGEECSALLSDFFRRLRSEKK